MPRHLATGLAEASLFLHKQHAAQRDRVARFEAAETVARAELTAEGKALTVRNVVMRQYEIAART